MSAEVRIKVNSDGSLIIERHDDVYNNMLYEALSDDVKDKSILSNFLFQWKGREILFGDGSLCG